MSRKKRARRREVGAQPELREPVARALIERWHRWLVPVLIALVTFAAFLPALQNQFVSWDDPENFLDNPHYRGLAWSQLRWMWTTFHMGLYMPLTWMTLGLDYLLWGMNPFGYHLTNLLLHATNAVVFYFVALWILTLALPSPSERGHALAGSASFAALLFALHPLRVESVAWVTERRDVLSGLLYLLTILVYLRACEREGRGRWWYWLSVVLFACALLSKSMAVSLPVVLLILDVYPLRRVGRAIGWWSEPARRVYAEKIPFVLLVAAACPIAFKALFALDNMASLVHLSVLGRLALSAYSLGFYLWKMLVPVNLSPLYALPPTLNPRAMLFVPSYGLVLAITALALTLRRRVPGLPAVWGAYVVVLLPVLGIFQNGPQIAADRYTYLAGLGWAILAGAGLLSCWRASRRSQTGTPTTSLLAGIAICIVVGLGVLTWKQVQVWRDSQRLWTHAVALDPNSPLAQFSLGIVLSERGKPTEAIEHFREALRMAPDLAGAHDNWGQALNLLGKPTEAIEHFREALRIKPNLAEAHNNWGQALGQQVQLDETIGRLLPVGHIEPELLKAAHRALALGGQATIDEAIEHFQQALRINPELAEAHSNLGLALVRQGKLAEAIEHFQQAVHFRPDYARAHSHWGQALIRLGKLDEAIEHFREALRIAPDLAEARANLGLALARQGTPAEATERQQAQERRKVE